MASLDSTATVSANKQLKQRVSSSLPLYTRSILYKKPHKANEASPYKHNREQLRKTTNILKKGSKTTSKTGYIKQRSSEKRFIMGKLSTMRAP